MQLNLLKIDLNITTPRFLLLDANSTNERSHKQLYDTTYVNQLRSYLGRCIGKHTVIIGLANQNKCI